MTPKAVAVLTGPKTPPHGNGAITRLYVRMTGCVFMVPGLYIFGEQIFGAVGTAFHGLQLLEQLRRHTLRVRELPLDIVQLAVRLDLLQPLRRSLLVGGLFHPGFEAVERAATLGWCGCRCRQVFLVQAEVYLHTLRRGRGRGHWGKCER